MSFFVCITCYAANLNIIADLVGTYTFILVIGNPSCSRSFSLPRSKNFKTTEPLHKFRIGVALFTPAGLKSEQLNFFVDVKTMLTDFLYAKV